MINQIPNCQKWSRLSLCNLVACPLQARLQVAQKTFQIVQKIKSIKQFEVTGNITFSDVFSTDNLEIVKLLIQHGANQSMRMGDPPKENAAELASQLGHGTITKYFKTLMS